MTDTLFPRSISYINKSNVEKIVAFRDVSYKRWADAVASYQNGRYLAAVYLAGYSLECILKYTILESKFPRRKNFSFTQVTEELNDDLKAFKEAHRLDLLIDTGNHHKIFQRPTNKESYVNVLTRWKSEWRYSEEEISPAQAKYFLNLVREFVQRLIENTNGRLMIRSLQPFE